MFVGVYLLVTAFETRLRVERVEEFTESSYKNSELERSLVFTDRNDDLHWVLNVQRSVENDQVRLRSVDYDNSPFGRSVHWSSVYSWWIQLLVLGKEVDDLEWASAYANLVLSTLFLLGLTVWIYQALGPKVAWGVPFLFASILVFRDTFKFGVGDHHAAAILCSMVGVLALLLAFIRPTNTNEVRISTIVSSLCLALAMWINLVSVVPVLIGIGFGILLARFKIRSATSVEYSDGLPSVVRLWARTGCGFAIMFYIFEYAPFDMTFRLEVNHPFYALAWLGGGELLASLFDTGDRRRKFRIGVGFVLLVPVPLAILLYGADVMHVFDPFLAALHERYLSEFRSLLGNLANISSKLRILALLAPFSAFFVGVVLWIRNWEQGASVAYSVCLGPLGVLILLTLYQARWWSEAGALIIPLVVYILFSNLARWVKGIVVATFLPGSLIFVYGAFAMGGPSIKTEERIQEKEVARYLNLRFGESVVLASPDATTNLIYYGGHRGIGTFYWENNEGLKRAAKIFSSDTMELAHQRIVDSEIDFVVVFSWGGFEKEYLNLYRDYSDNDFDPEKSFLVRLVQNQEIPVWLKPIPFRLPAQELALVFQVVSPMTAGKLTSVRFEYLLEMGFAQAAHSLEGVLRQHMSDPAALVSLCRLYAMQEKPREFSAALEKLLSMDRSGPLDMSLGDSIRYSGILAIAGVRDAAEAKLQDLVSGLSSESLSELNPEAIRHLWDLVDALGVTGYEESLRERSTELLPNRLRPVG